MDLLAQLQRQQAHQAQMQVLQQQHQQRTAGGNGGAGASLQDQINMMRELRGGGGGGNSSTSGLPGQRSPPTLIPLADQTSVGDVEEIGRSMDGTAGQTNDIELSLEPLTVHASSEGDSGASAITTTSESVTTECGGADPAWIRSSRMQADFWAMSSENLAETSVNSSHTSATTQLIIRPTNATLLPCPALSLALFTASLVNTSATQFHLPLPNPSPSLHLVGAHMLELHHLEACNVPAGRYALVVTLEVGAYPGLRSGQPCEGALCRDGDVAKLAGWERGVVAHNGSEIGGSRSVEVAVQPCGSDVGLRPQCVPPFDRVSAYSENGTVRLVGCDFPDVRRWTAAGASADVNGAWAQGLGWIHFLGDSNTRNWARHFARAFLLKCEERSGAGSSYATHILCLPKGGGGVRGRDEGKWDRAMVVIYTWWYQDTEKGGPALPPLDLEDLLALPEYDGMGAGLDGWGDGVRARLGAKPVRRFLSLGSHDPCSTSAGTRAFLEHLVKGEGKALIDGRTTLVLTTPVRFLLVPNKYSKHIAMRNNANIGARNEVARQVVAAAGNNSVRVLDAYGVGEAGGEDGTGFCETSEDDHGTHTVCVLITDSFLAHQKSVGNDLSTPRPEFGFPGLKDGDRWCVCALRWKQAMEAGVAGRLMLESTNFRTLEALGMTVEELMKFDAGNGTAGGIGGGKDEL
ncbi:hypothetical protein HK101_001727 [Irineochytrium annulatum]|nr:hypothetical protein HK101_001727 [Irineochytrium annulatum]